MTPARIKADKEGFRAELEIALNDLVMLLELPNSAVTITNFDISGGQTITIELKMSITGWNDLIMMAAPANQQMQTAGSTFLNCLGVTPESFILAMLSASGSLETSISGSNSDEIAGRMTATSAAGGGTGGISLNSFNMQVNKLGQTMELSGSASLNDVQTFIGCAMRNYLPGTYKVENLQYSLTKAPDSTPVQTLEGGLTGLAQKSGPNWLVSFPSETTSSMNITVNAPSGMSIISIEGGQKTGDRSAVSTGGDFTVTYGKAGADYTIWIIAAVVILLLLVLTRKKKK